MTCLHTDSNSAWQRIRAASYVCQRKHRHESVAHTSASSNNHNDCTALQHADLTYVCADLGSGVETRLWLQAHSVGLLWQARSACMGL